MGKFGSKNLTYTQRLQLETLYNAKVSKKEIAEQLGVSLSTIYRELERGTINNAYNPEYSTKRTYLLNKAKGKTPKLEADPNLALFLSKLILEENLSIGQVIKKCKSINIYCPSKQALYTAIDRGQIPNVTRDSLKSNTTTMFSKGLIQIPKHIREQLNIHDKDILKIVLDGNKIIVEKCY